MAKLTVFFKYKAIDTFLFDSGVVHIGRDDTNDISIDSLAVAPAHAVIILRDDVCKIKQLNENFPLIINGQKVKECELNHNDMITIGKHDIVYSTTESVAEPNSDENTINYQSLNLNMDSEAVIPSANLQVMNGNNIGKVLPLKKAMTRLGNSGSGVVVIAKRKDGYYASVLENIGTITLNNRPLDNNFLKLNNNDVLAINQVSLQFFLS